MLEPPMGSLAGNQVHRVGASRNGSAIGHGASRRSAGDVALGRGVAEGGGGHRRDGEGAIHQRIAATHGHDLTDQHRVGSGQGDRGHVGG